MRRSSSNFGLGYGENVFVNEYKKEKQPVIWFINSAENKEKVKEGGQP